MAMGASPLIRSGWACALALGTLLGCSSPESAAGGAWVEVWSDEFNGAAGAPVDTTKWRYDTADGFMLVWLDLGPLGPEMAGAARSDARSRGALLTQ